MSGLRCQVPFQSAGLLSYDPEALREEVARVCHEYKWPLDAVIKLPHRERLFYLRQAATYHAEELEVQARLIQSMFGGGGGGG